MTREEYLSAVEEQIRCKKVRPMVRRELEDHIQDQRDAYISEGKIGREAEKLAVCQMGDPVETGRALDRIHRPRMKWMLPLMAVLLSACGLMIQYLSLTGSGEEMTLLSFFERYAAGLRDRDHADDRDFLCGLSLSGSDRVAVVSGASGLRRGAL